MTVTLLLDLLLVGAILVVAYRALHAEALFTAIVMYIVFGLLMALVWVRLEAPDLALAEAAIGAGITGALLLDAAGQLGSDADRVVPRRGIIWYLATGGGALVTIAVGVAALSLDDRRPGFSGEILDRAAETGATHPVTAVLLGFRGYDTWLEIGVLLAAGMGVLALRRGNPLTGSSPRLAGSLTIGTTSLLIPVALLVGGYLLWRGSDAPGGAFQAGAVIAGAGVVMVLTRGHLVEHFDGRSLALLVTLVAGFLTFLTAALITLASGGRMLEYPPAYAGITLLLIESAVAVSVAVGLVLLFAAGRPAPVHEAEGDP